MLNKNLLAIASLTGVGLLPLAQAADQYQDNRWYVAPFASFVKTGGDRNSSDGWWVAWVSAKSLINISTLN